MLDLLRKKQKSVLVQFVFWAIIAAFVGTIFLVWGQGGERGSDGSITALTVNDDSIGIDEYQTTYRNVYTFYQNLYRDNFNAEMEQRLGLARQAADQLVRRTLLEQEGERLGIKVPRKEVVESIAKIPAFQVNGVFDRTTYVNVLNYQRLTPEMFEILQERDLFVQKVEDHIKAGVTVTDTDIEDEYRSQNEKINLAFVRLAPSMFESKVKVDTPSLQEYFDNNREDFRVPEKVAISYLQFEPARYVDEVEISEQDLNKYFERHMDRYIIDEQVSASHVLIKVDTEASEETRTEKRKLAEKVLAKAKAGEDFAALARKYSDDTGSAARGGALGYFSRGSMVPTFEAAAFAMNPGEISDIVESPFGLHIIKVDGHIEPGTKPLDEVIDDVKAGVRKEKSVQLAYEKAVDAYNINRKTGDLEKAAKDFDLGVKDTGLFARDEAIDGISAEADIVDAAFALQEGELSKPIRLEQGVFVIAIKERQASHLPEFADVEKQVEEAYRAEQGAVLARKVAGGIHAGALEGKSLESLAKKERLKVEETGEFSKNNVNFVPRIGNPEGLLEAAFGLTGETPVAPEVYEVGDRFVVAVLKDFQAADMTALDDAKREQLRKSVETRMQQEAVDNRVNELIDQSDIRYSDALKSYLERG